MRHIISLLTGFLSTLLKRFISFLDNVRVFLSPKVVTINLIGNQIKLNNSSKDSLTRVLIKDYGVWEVDELNLFCVISKGAETFIDIGANIGLYTILAEKCNAKVSSYAFEPAPANAKRLLENFSLNSIKRAKLIQKAVGDSDSSVSFFVPADNSSTSVSSTSKAFTSSWHNKPIEITVPLITLDRFVQEEKINKVDLIKLDAEYYELNVLRGALDLFKRDKPSVICEVNIYEVLSFYLPDMKERISKNLSYDIESFFKEINYYSYSIGKDGIMRTESIHVHPDARNFLFSPIKSDLLFIPYTSEKDILDLLHKF